jgi:hypothetical protein
VNETNLWQPVTDAGVKAAIMPWLGQQFYLSGGFERKLTRDSAVSNPVYETLLTMGETGRKAFQGVPLQDSVLDSLPSLATLSGRSMTAADFVTWVLPFKLDQLHAAGKPEKILRFLSGELEGTTRFRPQDIQIIREFFGYCLTSDNQYQKGLWIQGMSRNGKSVILDLLRKMLGDDNVAARATKDFKDMANDDLLGKRLVCMGDLRRGHGSEEILQFLLNVIGDDPIRVRKLHVGGESVKLGLKVAIASNFHANVKDTAGAIANRLLPISRQGPAVAKEDPALIRELYRELPALLKWSLEGLKDLNERGNFDPSLIDPGVLTAVRRNTMPVFAFLQDKCFLDGSKWTSWRNLYKAWARYADETGHHKNLHMEEFKLGVEAAGIFLGQLVSDVYAGGENGAQGVMLKDGGVGA